MHTSNASFVSKLPNLNFHHSTQQQSPLQDGAYDTNANDTLLANAHPHDPVLAATAGHAAPMRLAHDKRATNDKLCFRTAELSGLLFSDDSDPACLKAIQPLLENAYGNNPTFRRLANDHLAVKPNNERCRLSQGDTYSTTVTEKQIEKAGGREMRLALDADGSLREARDITATRAVMHELVHLITGLRDDPDGHNPRGTVVEYTNIIMAEAWDEKARADYGAMAHTDDGRPEGVGGEINDIRRLADWRISRQLKLWSKGISSLPEAEKEVVFQKYNDLRGIGEDGRDISLDEYSGIWTALAQIENKNQSEQLKNLFKSAERTYVDISSVFDTAKKSVDDIQKKEAELNNLTWECSNFLQEQQFRHDCSRAHNKSLAVWEGENEKETEKWRALAIKRGPLNDELANPLPQHEKVVVEVTTVSEVVEEGSDNIRDPHGRDHEQLTKIVKQPNKAIKGSEAKQIQETNAEQQPNKKSHIENIVPGRRTVSLVTETHLEVHESNAFGQLRPNQPPTRAPAISITRYVDNIKHMPEFGFTVTQERQVTKTPQSIDHKIVSTSGQPSIDRLQKLHLGRRQFDSISAPKFSPLESRPPHHTGSSALVPFASRAHSGSSPRLLSPGPQTGAISKRSPTGMAGFQPPLQKLSLPVLNPIITNPIKKITMLLGFKKNLSDGNSRSSLTSSASAFDRPSLSPSVLGIYINKPTLNNDIARPQNKDSICVSMQGAGEAVSINPTHAFSQPTSIVIPMAGIEKSYKGDGYAVTFNGYNTPVQFDCANRVWRIKSSNTPLTFSPGVDKNDKCSTGKWERITEEELSARPQPDIASLDAKSETIILPSIKPVPADAQPIPKNIHYIWVGGEMPEKIVQNIISNTNKSYDAGTEAGYRSTVHVDVNDPAIFAAIKDGFKDRAPGLNVENLRDTPFFEVFKETDFYRQYSAAKDSDNHCYAAAADVLRYPLLHHGGGIYIDADDTIETNVVNIDLKASGQDLLLPAVSPHGPMGMPKGFMNSILGSQPNNPLLKKISERSYAIFKRDPSFFDRLRPYLLHNPSGEFNKRSEENEQCVSDYLRAISEMGGPGMLNAVLGDEAQFLYGDGFELLLHDEGRKRNYSLPSKYKQALRQSFEHYLPFSSTWPVRPGNMNSWKSN